MLGMLTRNFLAVVLSLEGSSTFFLFLWIWNAHFLYPYWLLELFQCVSPSLSDGSTQLFLLFSRVCGPLTFCIPDGGWTPSSNIGLCGSACSMSWSSASHLHSVLYRFPIYKKKRSLNRDRDQVRDPPYHSPTFVMWFYQSCDLIGIQPLRKTVRCSRNV